MLNVNERPILGVSVGDPGGIGPEITIKSLNSKEIYDICRPVAVADLGVMQNALSFSGVDLKLNPIKHPSEGRFQHGTVDVLDMDNLKPEELTYKKVTAAQGRASFEYVKKVIELAMAGDIDGTVTGPINKEAINAAGFHYAGHTEIYADMTNTSDYAMMLADGDFRVVHVSTHVSLREACDRVKKDRVFRVIDLAQGALKQFGIEKPRIAVAGLNPHCGENGLFGFEDDQEIRPAVELAVQKGIDADGPLPADTIFSKMQGGMYDVVVVMYHDQGHIPMKLVGFQLDQQTNTWKAMAGVNITLGLPIVRTSVDHGTAFGKAGEGRANEQSMVEAIRLGALMSNARLGRASGAPMK